ncbi:MAG: thioredoxin [Candidatus Omnitrophota bacterium]|nr:thioredoxin [Candidatus Omnitrophota bacterium]
MSLVHLSEKTFNEEVIKSNLPVLVDFWAQWCGPCKRIAPIIDELSQEYAGKIKIAKVNVDEEPNIASRYGIMSIPTLIIFKAGKAVDQIIGLLSKAQLKSKINENL